MSEELARLIELADMVRARRPGAVIYDANGDVTGEGIFTEPPTPGDPLRPGGAGQLCRMRAGQIFGTHAHYGCTELLTVVCGVLHVTTGGRCLRLSPGDTVRLMAGQEHMAEAMTDVVVVGITIPRDGGYPDGTTAGFTESQPGPS